jgi:hypothetical protein
MDIGFFLKRTEVEKKTGYPGLMKYVLYIAWWWHGNTKLWQLRLAMKKSERAFEKRHSERVIPITESLSQVGTHVYSIR